MSLVAGRGVADPARTRRPRRRAAVRLGGRLHDVPRDARRADRGRGRRSAGRLPVVPPDVHARQHAADARVLRVRGDVPDRPAGAAERRPRRCAPPAASAAAARRSTSSLQSSASALAPVVVGILSDVYGLRTAFLIVLPLMAVSGLILLPAVATYVREERALRREIRAEAIGTEDRRSTHDGSTSDRREGETFGPGGDQAGAHRPDGRGGRRPARHRGSRRVVRRDPGAVRGVDCVSPTAACTPSSAATGSARRRCSTPSPGWSNGATGRILYDGLDLTGVPPDQRVKLGITLMSAGRSIFPTLTVEENLWIGAFPFHEHQDARSGTARRRARRVPGDAPPAAPVRRHACRAASNRWCRWRVR